MTKTDVQGGHNLVKGRRGGGSTQANLSVVAPALWEGGGDHDDDDDDDDYDDGSDGDSGGDMIL